MTTLGETLQRCLTGEISLAWPGWGAVLKYVLLASLIGGGIVLVLEPDHTSGLPLFTAFSLWSTHIFFVLVLFLGSLAMLLRIGLPGPLPAIVAILLLPAIFAPVSLLLDIGFGNPDEELATTASLAALYLSEVVAVVPVTFAAALAVTFVLYRRAALREPEDQSPQGDTLPLAFTLSDLITTIPSSLGDDIIRMHAQDHYVEVVTAAGRTLISERFSDCVAKLDHIEGIQCHRSHWISLHHVTDLSPLGSAYVCTMSNGDRVPVSRRRYSELRRWLGLDERRKRSNRSV